MIPFMLDRAHELAQRPRPDERTESPARSRKPPAPASGSRPAGCSPPTPARHPGTRRRAGALLDRLPVQPATQGRSFLDNLQISRSDKEKISHRNADQLPDLQRVESVCRRTAGPLRKPHSASPITTRPAATRLLSGERQRPKFALVIAVGQ